MNGKDFDALKKTVGRAGENAVAKYVKRKGFKVVAKNLTTPFGELDLIATDGEYVVFIEVKTRSNASYGAPSEAVDYIKRKHMIASAKHYLQTTEKTESYSRFDVAEVFCNNGKYEINYIEDAFYVE